MSRPVQISWFLLVCLSTAIALTLQPCHDTSSGAYATLYALQVACLALFWRRMVAEVVAGGLFRCRDATVNNWRLPSGDYNATVMGYTGSTSAVRKETWWQAASRYDAFWAGTLVGVCHDDGVPLGRLHERCDGDRQYDNVLEPPWLLRHPFHCRPTAYPLPRCPYNRGSTGVGASSHHDRVSDYGTLHTTADPVCSLAQVHRLHDAATVFPSTVTRCCTSTMPPHPLGPTGPLAHPLLQFFFVQTMLVITHGYLASTHAGESLWQKGMILVVDCVAEALSGAEVMLAVVAYGVRYLTRAPYMADVVLFAFMVVSVASPLLRFTGVVVFVTLMKGVSTGLALLPAIHHMRMLLSSGAIALLILFTYAVVDTLLLGDIATDGVYLSEKRDFSTVIEPLLMLVDCGTFDQWHLVLHACYDGAACHRNASAPCGHTYSAVTFFVSFIVIASLIVGHLHFATIVATFSVPLFIDVIQFFIEARRVWQMGVGADLCACHFDTVLTVLPRFSTRHTDGITSETASKPDVIAFLSSLRLPLDENLGVRYDDVLRGFAYRKYNMNLAESSANPCARDRLTCLTAGEHYGQLLLQRYRDDVSRLAYFKVGGLHLSFTGMSAASPPHDSDGEHNVFRRREDGLLVLKGALPIPSSNAFLYTFPGDSNDGGILPSTS
ncbi:Ion transport protein [Leishmania braziliensis]|nr:Ion transport protein [Leishmania braziliensis]